MGCLGGPPLSEFEFIRAARTRLDAQCVGPVVTLCLPLDVLLCLQESLHSPAEHERLWAGVRPDRPHSSFALCVAHWMQLCQRCARRSRIYARADWAACARLLHVSICTQAGWDRKEFANMVHWQKVHPSGAA